MRLAVNHRRRDMIAKSYDELKAEMVIILQQMVEATKNKFSNAFEEVNRLCKEFRFIERIFKSALTDGLKEEK